MIDLNLLRTFDALMEQRSVTRAASQLSVTQSAISHGLARLRKALDDPLFVRLQNGLQPTSRAEEIAGGVRRALRELQDALAPTAFDPATAVRHFTIAAGSYFSALVIPGLVEALRKDAPGLSLRLVPSTEALVALLDRGKLDLALGTLIEPPIRIVVEPLYEEKTVWIAAPDNPILRSRPTPDQIDGQPRIVIHPARPFGIAGEPDENVHPDQESHRSWPPSRRNRITVYDAQTAVALVARTDLIAQVPEKVGERAVAEGQVVPLNWISDRASYTMVMIWHASRCSDPGLSWLRDTIRQTACAKSGRE